MAAPMACRSLRLLGRNFLQCRQNKQQWVQQRFVGDSSISTIADIHEPIDTKLPTKKQQDPLHYHDDKVSYMPAEEAKRSLEAEYPQVEILRDEFKFVERLIPSKTVPPPKQHEAYPTPSGWVPPNADKQPSEYGVRRTRNHMLPLYYKKLFSGREVTRISHIYGDIWKLQDDLKAFISKEHAGDKRRLAKKIDIQVHEVARFIRVRGNFVETVSKFLLEKGF